MKESFLGIDISKSTFDVALLFNNKVKTKKFNNNTKGFNELKQWLACKSITTCPVCMEATGSYSIKIAEYLYVNNFKVSVVNPARIKGFAMSKLSRVKTDKKDSELIANFCKIMTPDLWQPTPKHIQELQQWVKRLDNLIANKSLESNRLESADENVVLSIKSHIEFLNNQIEEVEKSICNHIKKHEDLNDKSQLLTSIPGVGEKTIGVILAFLNTENFNSVKQVVAFLGLNPQPKQSGTSVCGRSRISKTGDASLRKAFYMPALVSIRFNPIVKEFAERLSTAGKSKMVVVIASMRKLIHIIYGVLKNKTPFNPEAI
jgi:transposase